MDIGIWILILLIWLGVGINVNAALTKKYPRKQEVLKGYPSYVQVIIYLFSALLWPVHLIMTYITHK
ncbi:hypothetical protein ES704_01991 [subsurface metagenome]|jgi:hypothetical protein